MQRAFLIAGLAVGGLFAATESSLADQAFYRGFVGKYVHAASHNAHDKAFAERVAKVRCGVCHEGEDKHHRNAYGRAIEKFLDRERDAQDAAKIRESLTAVESLPSDPTDDASPTFGDLIRSGKLPGGEPEKPRDAGRE